MIADLPERYSDDTATRAQHVLERNRERVQHVRGLRWLVQSPPNTYVVDVIEGGGETRWATCSCPNGAAKGGLTTCWHTAVALLIHADNPERPKL